MNELRDRQAERYGAPLVSRRTARLLTALAAVVFLAVVLMVALPSSDSSVHSEVYSYDHLDNDVIAVEYVVTMEPGTEASCRIQALNKGRAQVGFVETTIPAQQEKRTAHQVEISTQGEAVSAEIISCSAL